MFLPKSCICRTGGYQWEVAAQMMDEEGDFTGMNARWLLDGAKAPPAYIDLLSPDADTDTGLSDALLKLYTALGTVPDCDYLLSYDAKVLFQAFQHQSVDEATAEEKLGLQVVYPKNQSYVARLALLLHIVNATLRGETPAPVISGDTMRQAIALLGYYLWQYRMIYKHNHPDSGLEGLGLKVQRFAQKAGIATASSVKRGVSAFKKVVVGTIRQVFESLAASGWGRTEGSGENMVYIPNADPINPEDRPVDAVDGQLMKLSTAVTPSNTGVEAKVDEIDKIDSPDISTALDDLTEPDEPDDLKPGPLKGEVILENHQFINSSPQTPVEQAVEPIDDGTQPDHQLSTSEPNGELLNDASMAAWHQRLLACQTLDDATDFCTALDALTPLQRHKFDSSVPDSSWAWLFNLPELKEPEPSASESVPEVRKPESSVSDPVDEPTLDELKALLLACDSLVQLNELKRSHRKTIATVYRSMSEKEQGHVDALAALAVPYKVYKYLGDEIRLGSQRLIRGTLVYVDPQTRLRSTARSAGVWAINGVTSGWVRPIEVSFSQLKEVVKFVLQDYQERGQQMGFC